MKTITLTTDFGVQDWFVGTMKGVIAGINPQARTLDITHGVPGGDIRAGAFALAASYGYFPTGTIHVAVVDPGVGSGRPALAVRTERYYFIGPDNGLLSWALRKEKMHAIHRLENPKFFLHPVSQTFHGRDVFAPAAAHISRGVSLGKLGPAVREYVKIPWPEPTATSNGLAGEILYLDQFGNALTNLEAGPTAKLAMENVRILVRGKSLGPVRQCYQAVPEGKPVCLPGSSGMLEIAVNHGSAASELNLKVGDPVLITSIESGRRKARRPSAGE